MTAEQAVIVKRVLSPPLLAALAIAAIQTLRQRRDRSRLGLATSLAVIVAVAGTLGAVRVIVSADGLRVGFGWARWPERQIHITSIRAARIEHGTWLHYLGLGYRIGPDGTRVVLNAADTLVVDLANGRSFGITMPDAGRAAALLNSQLGNRNAEDGRGDG